MQITIEAPTPKTAAGQTAVVMQMVAIQKAVADVLGIPLGDLDTAVTGLYAITPKTALHSYIAARAEAEKLPLSHVIESLAAEVGVGVSTIKRWKRTGLPTTGNKRDVAAIAAVQAKIDEWQNH